MVDLEQQISAWVDAEVDGVAPVTVDEVAPHGHAPAPTALAERRAPQAKRLALVAAVVVALVAGAAIVRLATTDDPAPSSRTSDLVQTTVPDLGWTLTRPEAWSTASRRLDRCGKEAARTSTIITNQPRPVSFDPSSCDLWDGPEAHRSGFVGIELGRKGPNATTSAESTPLPVDLDDRDTFDLDPDQSPREYWAIIDVQDQAPAYIRVWIAADADPADITAMHRLVRSIAWPTAEWPDGIRNGASADATGSPLMTTFLVCMRDRGYDPTMHLDGEETPEGAPTATVTWARGDVDRATFDEDHNECWAAGEETIGRYTSEFSAWLERPGPSQSSADAARDHVVPELAALPLRTRAGATRFFDAAEGTWAITVVPNVEPGTDCTLGDPEGADGIDRICTTDYGEVLLVDAGGSVVRAYPMPGEVPTWLYATRDAVFAGRVGEGDRPESTIVRIDRRTLDAKVLVFPSGPGTLGVPWPEWSTAPAGADISKLVVVGDDSAGQLVDSTTGVTSIDLPAIEQLFA